MEPGQTWNSLREAIHRHLGQISHSIYITTTHLSKVQWFLTSCLASLPIPLIRSHLTSLWQFSKLKKAEPIYHGFAKRKVAQPAHVLSIVNYCKSDNSNVSKTLLKRKWYIGCFPLSIHICEYDFLRTFTAKKHSAILCNMCTFCICNLLQMHFTT